MDIDATCGFRFGMTAAQSAAQIGLSVEVHADLAGLVEFFQSHEQRLNPTFDADPNGHTPFDDAFWLACRDEQSGEVIASHAYCLFRDADFLDLVVSNRLLWRYPQGEQCMLPDLTPESGQINVHGDLAYGGCMFVHPAWRGLGLVSLLQPLSRAIGLAHWLPDYDTGLMYDKHTAMGLIDAYGYPFSVPLIRGRWAGYPGADFGAFNAVWLDKAANRADIEGREQSLYRHFSRITSSEMATIRTTSPLLSTQGNNRR